MGIGSKAAAKAGSAAAPRVASGFVRRVLDQAIDGIGPLPSAAASANRRRVDAGGDVEAAIGTLVKRHTALAGAQGFVTNLGGIASAAAAIPANVVGVTLVQCHLVAGIAHLRGWDLHDARVRNAILACMLGEDAVKDLLKRRSLPSSPMALATSPVHDPELDHLISREVTSELVARTAGKRAVTLVGRRVPLIGGVVGGGTDGWATWQIGQYAGRELRDRNIAPSA
ncbi:EcsC family protein [Aeromicrobium sp. CTD01-1L150]|uniref:EcsC family protein n=1 Tax=Aeromicrobium sp. CTD01-1L150 TaxID=3341830 RepID=UPI0035C19F6F